ncbi:metal-sensitive transcriptional regulator [Corynebacterium aquilae]|uniref:Cytoplasmic protein n=1 Tax=Corynebacterium aquilae DSM 44791 TaxID=1431546 RepID=A0A1L7CHZ9_9CORY|nr:metal-sensitive transcriptional regulator [Corynebacterium aquilae]APT85445.1 cytoplasmic protein [Corynebacterium aquilae DSM 44791]
MEIDPETVKPALTRLKRANGQLAAVIRMIEEGRPCEDIVTQIAAVSSAVDRAGFTIITHGMKECFRHDPTGESVDSKKLEKMFLSLR